MKITQRKQYSGSPFSAQTSLIDNGPGKWASTRVELFRNGNPIGEYIRNYSSLALETFYPFMSKSGQWYALYSTHYTALRVMKINEYSIEDWCGEEPSSYGFCPTDLYVPQYAIINEILETDNRYQTYDEFSSYLTDQTSSKVEYAEFGFLAGCVWGDDGSSKLKYINLQQVDQRLIEIEEKFGYWELPDALSLKECIVFGDSLSHLQILKAEWLDLQR